MSMFNEDSSNNRLLQKKNQSKTREIYDVSSSPYQETENKYNFRGTFDRNLYPNLYYSTDSVIHPVNHRSPVKVQGKVSLYLQKEQQKKVPAHPQKNITKIYGNIISKELVKLSESGVLLTQAEKHAVDEFQLLKQGQNVYFTMRSINQLLSHQKIAENIKSYLKSPNMLHGMMMSKRMLDKKTNVKYLKKFIDACDGIKLNNLKNSE